MAPTPLRPLYLSILSFFSKLLAKLAGDAHLDLKLPTFGVQYHLQAENHSGNILGSMHAYFDGAGEKLYYF